MAIEYGAVDDPEVTGVLELHGTARGDVSVHQGGVFTLYGTVTGDVIVQPGGIAIIRGTVNMGLVNYGGKVEIYGKVATVDEEGGGTTFVSPSAVVGSR